MLDTVNAALNLDNVTCVIFDMDGTLVDSEVLASQVFLEIVPELNLSVEETTTRYKGVHLTDILEDMEARSGQKIPEDFIPRYRARMAELYESDLVAFDGVFNLIEKLHSKGTTIGIASSGPQQKILNALTATGLDKYFGDNYFSSYEIKSWKPEPDIYFHAARQLKHAPANCLVVEDSLPGITAARAAGMRSILISDTSWDLENQPCFNSFRDMASLLLEKF